MAVSCTKAMLVILFFMHLKWEANWKWVLTVPASLMSMLLVLALVPDVGLALQDHVAFAAFASAAHVRGRAADHETRRQERRGRSRS